MLVEEEAEEEAVVVEEVAESAIEVAGIEFVEC